MRRYLLGFRHVPCPQTASDIPGSSSPAAMGPAVPGWWWRWNGDVFHRCCACRPRSGGPVRRPGRLPLAQAAGAFGCSGGLAARGAPGRCCSAGVPWARRGWSGGGEVRDPAVRLAGW